MITLTAACILTGCINAVPVVISNNPIRSYLTPTRKEKIDKSQFSCYVDGEFYTSCPK
jgi:hypothetical protein